MVMSPRLRLSNCARRSALSRQRHHRFAINCSVIVAVLPSPPRSRVRPTPAASVSPHRLLDAPGGVALADVLQHHRRRTQQRDRVGQPFAGDVRGAAVDRLEDGVALRRCSRRAPRRGRRPGRRTGRSSRRRTGSPSPARRSASGPAPDRSATWSIACSLELEERVIVGHLLGDAQEQAVAQRQHVGLVAEVTLRRPWWRASSKA